jgi:hypothetical protein
MKRFQPSSLPNSPQTSFYFVGSFVGWLICKASLFLLLLFFCLAAAAASIDTAKSIWQHPDVQGFVAALHEDLSSIGSSSINLDIRPLPHFKDSAKLQRGENRARRRLAMELGQRKASAVRIKEIR